jgi:hypothetical protein
MLTFNGISIYFRAPPPAIFFSVYYNVSIESYPRLLTDEAEVGMRRLMENVGKLLGGTPKVEQPNEVDDLKVSASATATKPAFLSCLYALAVLLEREDVIARLDAFNINGDNMPNDTKKLFLQFASYDESEQASLEAPKLP